MSVEPGGFEPPPYPYDRLQELAGLAAQHPGGCVDLSVGTPTDAPPPAVVEALAHSGAERGYPPSIGTPAFRAAAAGWMHRRLGVEIDPAGVAACIGTKELVAGVPQWLRLRRPSRDTVLYPAVSYPTYAMGATLAGCRAVPVAVDEHFRLDCSAIDPADAARALCLWVNTPGNPAGGLDDLAAAAAWGRAPRRAGVQRRVLRRVHLGRAAAHHPRARHDRRGRGALAVEAIQPGRGPGRVLRGRRRAGELPVGGAQARRVHGGRARCRPPRWLPGTTTTTSISSARRYQARLARMQEILAGIGIAAPLPQGAFYLWVPAPDGDAWSFARRLAVEAGVLVSPGEFYGAAGADHVRLAMVRPDDQLDLVARRLGVD